MKICVFGAGAVGSFLGANLTNVDAEVTLFGRGAHLEKMRADGLLIKDASGNAVHRKVRCESDISRIGKQDFVISTLKAHSLTDSAAQIKSLLGPDTAVVFAQNGIPWWYFHRSGTAFDGQHLDMLDPGHVIFDALPPERAIGGVIFIGAGITEPGVLLHSGGDHFIFGELDGSDSPRLNSLVSTLASGNISVQKTTGIRNDLWLKLLGNISFNTVSLLTHGTIAQIHQDPFVYPPTRKAIDEAWAVATKLGVSFSKSIDERLEHTLSLGEYISSTLQDLRAKRHLEIEALIGAVCHMGRIAGVETPTLDLLYGFSRQLAQNLRLYPNMPPVGSGAK